MQTYLRGWYRGSQKTSVVVFKRLISFEKEIVTVNIWRSITMQKKKVTNHHKLFLVSFRGLG